MNTQSFAIALLASSILASAAMAAPAPKAPVDDSFFAGKFAGSVGFASNYVFRGVSQTADAPAVQGNIDYVFNNGRLQ